MNPDYKGVCHVALAQEGHCRPGEVILLPMVYSCLCFYNKYQIWDGWCFQVLLGTDSHTCTAGAFGQFASGIGNTDAGFILGTGKSLLKVCQNFSSIVLLLTLML